MYGNMYASSSFSATAALNSNMGCMETGNILDSNPSVTFVEQ